MGTAPFVFVHDLKSYGYGSRAPGIPVEHPTNDQTRRTVRMIAPQSSRTGSLQESNEVQRWKAMEGIYERNALHVYDLFFMVH